MESRTDAPALRSKLRIQTDSPRYSVRICRKRLAVATSGSAAEITTVFVNSVGTAQQLLFTISSKVRHVFSLRCRADWLERNRGHDSASWAHASPRGR